MKKIKEKMTNITGSFRISVGVNEYSEFIFIGAKATLLPDGLAENPI